MQVKQRQQQNKGNIRIASITVTDMWRKAKNMRLLQVNIKGFVGKYISRRAGEDKGLVKPDETASKTAYNEDADG